MPIKEQTKGEIAVFNQWSKPVCSCGRTMDIKHINQELAQHICNPCGRVRQVNKGSLNRSLKEYKGYKTGVKEYV